MDSCVTSRKHDRNRRTEEELKYVPEISYIHIKSVIDPLFQMLYHSPNKDSTHRTKN